MRGACLRARSLAALLALAPAGAGLGACGEAGKAKSVSAPIVSEFGHVADASDSNQIAALVKRYYAAAAADRGADACGMLFFALAEEAPEKYGRPPGPPYLNGADTCQAVLARVFEHFHAQLQMRPSVALVHVNGLRARALLEWPALPPGYVEARREGGTWKLESLLAAALP